MSHNRSRGVMVLLVCSAMTIAPVLAAAQTTTVPAANCVTGSIIQQAAENARQNERGRNDQLAQLQDTLQADAISCMERIKNFMASQTIRSTDISGAFMQQLINEMANKACNIAMSKLGKAAAPLDGYNNWVAGTENSANAWANRNGLPNVATGSTAPVTPRGTTSTTNASTWDKLSCAFNGGCAH
jgi:hypothetical protein